MASAFDRLRPGGGSRPAPGPDRLVYRPVLARVVLVATAGIGVWWAVDLAVRGDAGTAWVFTLWTVAVVAALSCLFWRPAVVVDDEAVELRNVVRDVRVPWAALEAVETRYALTLHAGGRRHQSWAGAAPGRPSVTGQLLGRAGGRGSSGASGGDHRLPDPRWTPGDVHASTASRDLQADSGATAFMIEQRWTAWRYRHPDHDPSPTASTASTAKDPAGAPDLADAVQVRWRPLLPAVAATAALLAAALTPVLG